MRAVENHWMPTPGGNTHDVSTIAVGLNEIEKIRH